MTSTPESPTRLTAPDTPGQLGQPVDVLAMRKYLDQLSTWLLTRRDELDAIDAAAQSGGHDNLTGDIMLAMMLWKAVSDRQQLLLATWDGGRVGVSERERLSSLLWGRMDTTLDQSLVGRSALASELSSGLAVSLPEACRLNDALVQQLRMKLALDPAADEFAHKIKALRVQMERLRDQVILEPVHTRTATSQQLDGFVRRLDEIADKAGRGGDVGGLLGPLELEASRFERDLIVGGAHRREARDKIQQARSLIEDLTSREAALTQLAERCIRTVDPAPRYAVPDVQALGPVPNTPAELDSYVQKLSRVSKAMTIAQEAYGRALGLVDSITTELEAHRAKAAAHGVEDDPAVVRAYALTLETLGHRPAVIPICKHLVEYYRLVAEHAAQLQRGANS